jgi:hypothetical protein
MFKAVDPYTYTLNGPLYAGDDLVGLFTAAYQVTHNDDVQLNSGTAQTGVANPGVRKYVLSVTQRIVIYNKSGLVVSPQADISQYVNYPALLNVSVVATLGDGEQPALQLIGYSPHTVNTKVQTSGTTGTSTGQTLESSSSRTAGSSTAQTNSYGASVGMTGDMFSFGLSAETSTTTTSERSQTATSGSGTSRNQESSATASMSIEDWGAYALVNPATSCPVWTFGQEYPWDAIECRKKDKNGDKDTPKKDQTRLVVPNAMTVRLYDGASLFPPSHLSMFGINFSTHVQWIVTVDNSTSDRISLTHPLLYFAASHTLVGDKDPKDVAVFIDAQATTLQFAEKQQVSAKVDLGVLGLDPVGRAEAPAIVGFVPSKFTVPPTPADGKNTPMPFTIFANANTLLVRDTTDYQSPPDKGAGFSAGETALAADLSGKSTSLSFTMLFKVVDTADYALHFKHWKTTEAGVLLTIVVNGDKSTALTKYVDAFEAEGGESNILSIALRHQNFASVDYSDLLTMGLNSVEVTVKPIEGAKSAGYALRAVSIEPS